MQPYTHKIGLVILIHKIIDSLVASAQKLRYHHINIHHEVRTTLLKPCIFGGLGGSNYDRQSIKRGKWMQIKIEGPKCFLQFPIMVHKSITLYKRTPVHGILFSYPMVLIIEQTVCS